MKFSSVVLCLGSIAFVAANENRELYGYDYACIKSHSITLEDGICNYDAIARELQAAVNDDPACRRGTNVAKELRAIFMLDRDVSLDDVEDIVNAACEDAFYQLTFVEGVSYVDILDDSQQMVKEYFDGRGSVNSNHEFTSAQGLGESILTKVPFQWPGDSGFEFDHQIPRNVYSQFPNDHFARKKKSGGTGNGRTSKRNYGPIQNFDQCKLNTAMCCWQESTDPSEVYGQQKAKSETVDHNTDTCYVDMSEAPSSSRVRAGYSIFPSGLGDELMSSGESGAIRCHGFNWAEDPMHVSNLFKGNALFQASFQQHLERGGYVSPISGAPMCGCLEQMPVVTRADCTQIDVGEFNINVEISRGLIEVKIPESNKITFSPCTADPDERRLLESRRRDRRKLQEFTKADWYPRIKAEMKALGEPIKGCFKQKKAPHDKVCSIQPKMCLFETQVCADGLPYPVTSCKCPGGANAKWNCEPYACPEGLEIEEEANDAVDNGEEVLVPELLATEDPGVETSDAEATEESVAEEEALIEQAPGVPEEESSEVVDDTSAADTSQEEPTTDTLPEATTVDTEVATEAAVTATEATPIATETAADAENEAATVATTESATDAASTETDIDSATDGSTEAAGTVATDSNTDSDTEPDIETTEEVATTALDTTVTPGEAVNTDAAIDSATDETVGTDPVTESATEPDSEATVEAATTVAADTAGTDAANETASTEADNDSAAEPATGDAGTVATDPVTESDAEPDTEVTAEAATTVAADTTTLVTEAATTDAATEAVTEAATKAPTTPSPVTPSPVTPSPVTTSPITPSPVTPSPVTPSPVTPSPVTPSPVTAAPVTPAPVTPAPVTPQPTEAPGPAAISLLEHYELMVEKNMIVDKTNQVEQRLVGEGGCPRVVANFLRSQGIWQSDY